MELNRLMVDQAIGLLDLGPEERVLDLFCGLGNFTLPISRQVGEVVGVPTAAAIANAIYDAVGIRIKDLPITPEKVLRALQAKAQAQA